MKPTTNDRRISKNSVGIFADGGGAFYFSEEEVAPSQSAHLLSQGSSTDHETLKTKTSGPAGSVVFRIAALFRWRKL